ncbi:hypothetical protein DXG01_010671 [Tephrocybe rancida]|nr:hypothetical protein DXG01_010671 [Tephrocybe rancida]
MVTISILCQIVPRFILESDPENEQSYVTLCDAIRYHWVTLWKWVECGIGRLWHLKRHPLPREQLAFLLEMIHDLMVGLWLTNTKFGLCECIFMERSDAVLDLWHPHTAYDLNRFVEKSSVDTVIDDYLLGSDDDNEGGSWDRLVDHSGVSAADLTRLILGRSQRLFAKNIQPKFAQRLHCNITLSIFTKSPAQKHLITSGSIHLSTKFLVRTSEGTFTSPPLYEHCEQRRLIEDICQLLTDSFEQMRGIARIRRSLEAGLLRGILKCAPQVSSADVPQLCRLINTLSKYLPFSSRALC